MSMFRDWLYIHRLAGCGSGTAERHSPPQPTTQAILDPSLFPLRHSSCLVGRLQHGDTATPEEPGTFDTHLILPSTRTAPKP